MNENPQDEKRSHDVKDIDELRELLKTVREQVPGLLKDITAPLKDVFTLTLHERQAKDRAKAMATFYKELVASGMSEETAMRMTEQQFANPIAVFSKMLETLKVRSRSEKEE